MHRSSLIYRVNAANMTQGCKSEYSFSVEPVLERLALLSMLDSILKMKLLLSIGVHIGKNNALANGDISTYKKLQFQLDMIEKYRKH